MFVDRFYIVLFSALEQTHCARMSNWVFFPLFCLFFNRTLKKYIKKNAVVYVLTALTWLVPHESAAVSARSVYTMPPCTMSLHAN